MASLCNKRVKQLRIGYFLIRRDFTRHLVHTTDGKVIGEWGMRKWMQTEVKSLSAPMCISHGSLRLSAAGTTRRT
jgi:hypothetical protein